MICANKSITGARLHNEDSFLVRELEGCILVAVADGMGGMASGEIASRLTVDTLEEEMIPARIEESRQHALETAVREANLSVYRYAADNPSSKGMGSTLVCCLADSSSFNAANVGDSRLYLFHDGCLSRITNDHSYVFSLYEMGIITETEIRTHPMRNVITRAIGTNLTVKPDFFSGFWTDGDMLLLCSDGLHGFVTDDDICSILSMPFSPEELADLLVDAATRAGSSDNITAVLVRNEGGGRK